MTVSSTTSQQTFACNGATRIFVCPFRVLDASEVRAYLVTAATGASSELSNGTDFVVTGVGDANAVVTTTAAYGSEYQLKCARSTALLQPTDYRDNDPFPAESHEAALDRLTHIAQENDAKISRALMVPEPETAEPLPPAEDRAGRLLAFSDAGLPEASAFTSAQVAALLSAAAVVGASGGQVNTIETKTVPAGDTEVSFAGLVYTPGINALLVFADGLMLRAGTDYTESSSTGITLTSAFAVDTELTAIAGRLITGMGDSQDVTFLHRGTGAVTRDTRSKLRETRKSVEDFGGSADGATNNDAAIALAAAASGGRVHFPGPGIYVCSASVWGHAFTAGDDVTLKISGTSYNVSNAIAGPWRLTVDSSQLMSLRHAVTGNVVQQWQDGTPGTATYFYRGLSVQTDSHSMQMGPATNGGSCDLLWQRSTANADPAGNRFNVTFEEAQDRLLVSYATSASGAPAFDSAIQIYAGTSPQLLFPGVAAQFNVGVGVKQRAAGGFECRLVPTSSTVADLKQIGGSGTTYLRMSDGAMGFFGSSGTSRPTVTGSRGGNSALASLLSALAGLGLITNSTTV